ncbi:type I restriction enzyme HsdR N-terminal domain-containing protein [uncultured Desulfosarcina sp.]|uniref:type I restriction enzyme HsdR N-terminal domain-containing protein n=1 Tax=uncultured Desulfosarcina sp. TaxID=218289 RepID=UPI0029C854CD|nr:type I restriction enzyme HsdR N-terminal domain-containing protein [uncultured Desulfosarcina sp.]
MGGHHLILGELEDYLTGEVLADTHDERYRQKIARFLVEEKGYAKAEIAPRRPLVVAAGTRKGQLAVDFTIAVDGRMVMVIKYAPGSLVTRHRPTLAISRLIAPHRVPVVVVTNGESADILDGTGGGLIATGFDGIPSREMLARQLDGMDFEPVSDARREMEARIVYAFEIEGSCPCDDSTCRIP